MSGSWTQRRITLLAEMLDRKMSFGACAKELGVTRNAAIGKAGRCRACGDTRFPASYARPTPRPRPAPKPKVVIEPKSVARSVRGRVVDQLPLFAFVPIGRTRSIVELEQRECRYLASDGLYCAHRTDAGRSYCPHHVALVYVRAKKRAA